MNAIFGENVGKHEDYRWKYYGVLTETEKSL